jgi:hypothetical protein
MSRLLLVIAFVLGLATAAQAQYPVYAPYGYTDTPSPSSR